jgi:hypothetical protein
VAYLRVGVSVYLMMFSNCIHYTTPNGMILDYELEGMWNKAVMTYCKELLQQLPEKRKIMENLRIGSLWAES